MKRELDEELCKIAPHLFGDRYASMQTTCMCWGFEVGDGWFELLKEAALQLELLIVAYIDAHPEERNPFYWLGTVYYACHPWVLFWQLARWLKAEMFPRTAAAWWPRASQVKEKYGTLRFYMTSGTDEMYAIIDKAERQSSMTCETCGKKGKIRGRGWLYTRCAACWKREQHES